MVCIFAQKEAIKIFITMAEEKDLAVPAKSKRDQLGERLKKKYPDRDYPDDEALFGQINDDYDEYDTQLDQYKGREQELMDIMSKNPVSAQYISEIAKGNDPWIAMIERMGIDGITDLINNPEKQEAYAEANRKWAERLAKESKLKEEFEQNISGSVKLLEQIQQERQLDDATLDAAMDLVARIAHENETGAFTRETIELALNALTHDADVQNARTEGTVAGRNAKIDEKLRKSNTGDGMPNLAGSNNSPSEGGRRRPNFFDYAEAAQ